jgi:hypothetical protein
MIQKYYLRLLSIGWLRLVRTPDCADLTRSHDFFSDGILVLRVLTDALKMQKKKNQ